MIPRRLIRTVPETTSDEAEAFWAAACALHPGWDHLTLRDPIDPTLFPLTSPAWGSCAHGAQLAGLVRLEALWNWGGIYLDSDFEPFRPLDPLLGVEAFAGWEDERTVPDAVLGARPHHPAFDLMIGLALSELPKGPWASGPGVTTKVLPERRDVLLLPPASFYGYHYSERHRRWENHRTPFNFGVHHWAASWLKGG